MCTLKKVSVFVLRAAAALEGRVSKVLPLFGELRSKRERGQTSCVRTRSCVQVQCLGRASCAVLFGASAVVRYYKPRVEASVSVRHILASKKCHMGLGVDQKCGLRVPGYLAMTVWFRRLSAVVLACSLFPTLPFPLSHVRQEETPSD